jgi:hypothetical protein
VEHLYVVLCEVPAGDTSGAILAVRFNSPKYNSDRTVTIHPGEHAFVTHETIVDYDLMREFDVTLRLFATFGA